MGEGMLYTAKFKMLPANAAAPSEISKIPIVMAESFGTFTRTPSHVKRANIAKINCKAGWGSSRTFLFSSFDELFIAHHLLILLDRKSVV